MRKPINKSHMQMSIQAIPKIQSNSDNREDIIEDSFSDGTGEASSQVREEMKQKNIHMSALVIRNQLIHSESHVTSDVKNQHIGIPETKTSAFNASAIESKESIRQDSVQQYLLVSDQ